MNGKTKIFLVLLCVVIVSPLGGCSGIDGNDEIETGILWVRTAAEFDAVSMQAYRGATEDLQKFIDDESWTALPGIEPAPDLPLAIISDLDETVVSNVEFQVILVRPFSNRVRDTWSESNTAKRIPGATDFFHKVRDAGVEVFFVTNRPCDILEGIADPCPQQKVALQDLREVGIETDDRHLMMANEDLGWNREKSTRRELVAETHRVIMLLGDDLGDFVPCTRKKPLFPCSEGATIESRRQATAKFGQYWGEGWYVLPNPMHGSWRTVNQIE